MVGQATLIEGDHGSTYFHPDSLDAHRAIQSLVDLQKQSGGNANIGRELYRTTESDGVFCYTFFKAVAEKRDTGYEEQSTKWMQGEEAGTLMFDELREINGRPGDECECDPEEEDIVPGSSIFLTRRPM